MKKILLLISIMSLAGCTASKDIPNEVVQQIAPSGSMSTYETTLETTSDKIKSSEEFKACMGTYVNSCVQTSGIELARKNKSVEFCKELPNTEQQEGCAFAITLTNAQETYDKSLCATLSEGYKKQCENSIIRSEAADKQDISICKQLPVDTSTGATTPPDLSRDNCIMSIIIMNPTTTTSSCSEIVDTQMRDMCTTTVKNRSKLQ